MKMIYNGTPIKSLNIKHFEVSTNDCTMTASDLQSGVTGVARGKKITGTGKCFNFASYGNALSNIMLPIPSNINTVEIASTLYPVQQSMDFETIRITDFSNGQTIGKIIKDGIDYPISMQITNNILKLTCDITIKLQLFYGRDDYA